MVFFPFLKITDVKNATNSYFFCLACLCMSRSMSDNLKIQTTLTIIFNNFCQNLKVWCFQCILCVRKLLKNSGRFQCIVKARRSNSNFEKIMLLSLVFVHDSITKVLRKYNKKSFFWFMRKNCHTISSIFEKSVFIDLACNFLFDGIVMMKIVWLAFFWCRRQK